MKISESDVQYVASLAMLEVAENEKKELLAGVEPLMEQIPPWCFKIVEENFQEAYLLPPTTFDHVLPKKEREALLKALLGNKHTIAHDEPTATL